MSHQRENINLTFKFIKIRYYRRSRQSKYLAQSNCCCIPKPSGKTWPCLDMQQAKKTLICECYIIPKIEDISTELHRAKYCSKFDLTEGYHQMKLDPNSRHIATFHTCQGLISIKN